MTPQVRSSRPEDVADFMRLILMSDKAFLPYLFGDDFERIIRASFESGEGLFGYPNVRVVEADNRVAGMLLAYTHEQMVMAMAGFGSDYEPESDTGTTEEHYESSGEPGSDWVNPGEFYLANMAVFPELRRQGLGRMLLADAEARGRDKGCTRLALDVEAENRDAIRLYERLGFVREERDLNIMGRFRFQRFSKPVSGA